jgi:hypothetical protein
MTMSNDDKPRETLENDNPWDQYEGLTGKWQMFVDGLLTGKEFLKIAAEEVRRIEEPEPQERYYAREHAEIGWWSLHDRESPRIHSFPPDYPYGPEAGARSEAARLTALDAEQREPKYKSVLSGGPFGDGPFLTQADIDELLVKDTTEATKAVQEPKRNSLGTENLVALLREAGMALDGSALRGPESEACRYCGAWVAKTPGQYDRDRGHYTSCIINKVRIALAIAEQRENADAGTPLLSPEEQSALHAGIKKAMEPKYSGPERRNPKELPMFVRGRKGGIFYTSQCFASRAKDRHE